MNDNEVAAQLEEQVNHADLSNKIEESTMNIANKLADELLKNKEESESQSQN